MPNYSSAVEEFRTEHELYFSNRTSMMPDAVDIGSMISSYGRLLRAYQKVLIRIDPALEGSYVVPDLLLYDASGSSLIKWVVRFCWGDEAKAEQYVHDLLITHPRLRWIADRRKAIGVVVLGLVVLAPTVPKVAAYFMNDDEKPHLSGIQQQVIVIGSQTYSTTPEEFRRALIETLQSEPSLLADISRVVRPARRDPDAYIRFDKQPELSLKPDAIAEFPPSFNVDAPPREVKRLDVYVTLRATDLDNKRRWAAVIPSLSPNRVVLTGDVKDTKQLAGVAWLRGDVVVEEVKDEEGRWMPRKYRLTYIHSTDRQQSLYSSAPDASD